MGGNSSKKKEQEKRMPSNGGEERREKDKEKEKEKDREKEKEKAGDKGKYEEMIAKEPAEVGKRLQQDNISYFITKLLRDDDINIKRVLVYCNYVLSGGEDPIEFLENIKTSFSSSACTKIWGGADWFYRCRTCEVKPTSSICIECFKKGPHEKEGHDYSLENSIHGGSCDCGNIHAWNPAGACCDHATKGIALEDPASPLPPEVRARLRAAIAPVIQHLMDLLQQVQRKFKSVTDITPEPECPAAERAAEILKWLRTVTSYGAAILHVVCLEFAGLPPATSIQTVELHVYTHIKVKGIPLERTVLICTKPAIPAFLVDETVPFILEMLQDHGFKRIFTQYFGATFNELINMVLVSKIHPILLYKITPQILPFAQVTEPLATIERGLLDMMLQGIKKMFENVLVTAPDTGVKHVDLKSSIITHDSFCDFASFFNALLELPKIAQYMAFQRPDLIKMWLEILEFNQWADPTPRQEGSHVEYESENWKKSYPIETTLFDSITGVCAAMDPNVEPPAQLGRLVQMFTAKVVQWAKANAKLQDMGDFLMINMKVSDSRGPGVSFHLPLHRLISYALHTIMTTWPQLSLASILAMIGAPKAINTFATVFLDYVLQIHVLLAQIHAGMWVRNGNSILTKARIYKNVHYSRSFELDLFTMQTSVCIFGPDRFVKFALHRYELDGWFEGEDSNTARVEVAEDFLRLLMMVYSYRGQIGLDPKLELRNFIIHNLAAGDHTHQQLLKAIPTRLLKNPGSLKEVLKSVASYKKPTATVLGTYLLLPQCWAEFDIYFPFLDTSPMQQAIERFQEFRAHAYSSSPALPSFMTPPTSPSLGFSPFPSPVPSPSSSPILSSFPFSPSAPPTTFAKYALPPPRLPPPPFGQLAKLSQLVHSPTLHQIVLGVLRATVERAQSSVVRHSPPLLHTALAFLAFALRTAPAQEAAQSPRVESAEISGIRAKILIGTKEDRRNHLVGLLSEIVQDSECAEQQDLVYDILSSLHKYPKVQECIDLFLPGFFEAKKVDVPVVDEKEQKRKEAQKRQAEIMAKFQNQQKMFMQQAKASAGANDEDDEDDEDDDDAEDSANAASVRGATPPPPAENLPKCTLCRTSLAPIHDHHHKPMGLIALVQRSNVLATAQAHANCSRWWEVPEITATPRSTSKEESDTHDSHDFPDMEAFSLNSEWREYRKAVGDVYARLRPREDHNLHTQSCGHSIHLDCFTRYYDSMVKRHLQNLTYEGLGVIDLSRGQFLCPVCRRLSNALVPIIPKEALDTIEVNPNTTTGEGDDDYAESDTTDQREEPSKPTTKEALSSSGPLLNAMVPDSEEETMALYEYLTANLQVAADANNDSDDSDTENEEENNTNRRRNTGDSNNNNNNNNTTNGNPIAADTLPAENDDNTSNNMDDSEGVHLNKKQKPNMNQSNLKYSSSGITKPVPYSKTIDSMLFNFYRQTKNVWNPKRQYGAFATLLRLIHTNVSVLELALRGNLELPPSYARDQFIVITHMCRTAFLITPPPRPASSSLPSSNFNSNTTTTTTITSTSTATSTTNTTTDIDTITTDITAPMEISSTSPPPPPPPLPPTPPVRSTSAAHQRDLLLQLIESTVAGLQGGGVKSVVDKIIPDLYLNLVTRVLIFLACKFHKECISTSSPSTTTTTTTTTTSTTSTSTTTDGEVAEESFTDFNNYNSPDLTPLQQLYLYIAHLCLPERTQPRPAPPTSFLTHALHTLLLSRLRRWSLLLHALSANLDPDAPLPPYPDLSFEAVCAHLRLRDPAQLAHDSQERMRALVREWRAAHGDTKLVREVGWFTPATPCDFIRMPLLFQDIVIQLSDERCTRCNLVPRTPAVCIICGTLICASNECCMRSGMGEGTYHAATCGAGVGALVLARHTNLLLLRDSRATQWTSLYLDEWGEEDIGLKRGKPLHLNHEILKELTTLWVTHTLDHNSYILSQTARDGHHI